MIPVVFKMAVLLRKTLPFSIFLLLFSLLFLNGMAQTQPAPDPLRQRILVELARQKGVFAVAFKDLTTGRELLINEHETFHAASTMKTPVMIEAYRQADQHRFALSDSVLVKNDFKSIVDGSSFRLRPEDDSDTAIYKAIGTKRPLSSLIYNMIILSSNLATNIVIEQVDAKAVTQTMRNLGAKDIQVRRGVEDTKAFQQGLNNTVTAYDLGLIFEKMATGTAVSSQASQAMINILLDQRFKTVIPAKLPKDVKVAHKTGWIKGVRHDSGIVFLPDGRKYVLVLLSKEVQDDPAATEAMATVSEWIYQSMK